MEKGRVFSFKKKLLIELKFRKPFLKGCENGYKNKIKASLLSKYSTIFDNNVPLAPVFMVN